MARPLTADELNRYPWATRITDYIPVGRLRKIGLACTSAGAIVLLLGIMISLALSTNVRNAVSMDHPIVAIGVYIGIALAGTGLVIGIVTGVQAVARGVRSLLLWSLATIAPALLMLALVYPLVR